MEDLNLQPKTLRREFISSVAAGAAALSLGSLIPSLDAQAGVQKDFHLYADADEWFSKIKGKHRIVFDVPAPNDIFPFVWPKVFIMTNEKTGTPAKDSNAVVILRHTAIPYAFQSPVWEKYKFGETFKITDPVTKAPSIRNPFWQPKPDDFKVPGIGAVPLGISDLQATGIMFCVCDMAMTVYSAAIGQGMNMDPAVVKQDWMNALIPGVQPVPSGVWAVGRAQEHGCAYCFAG
jgi:intracellular sulfur oxidation DsrE/DsrF family protein